MAIIAFLFLACSSAFLYWMVFCTLQVTREVLCKQLTWPRKEYAKMYLLTGLTLSVPHVFFPFKPFEEVACLTGILALTALAVWKFEKLLFISELRDTNKPFAESGSLWNDLCSFVLEAVSYLPTEYILRRGTQLLVWAAIMLLLIGCVIMGEITRRFFWSSLRSRDPLGFRRML